MRDPVMYRILHAEHHRTGEQVVHLPDVRLRPRPVAIPSSASPTPSARWNSRITGRSTIGIVEQLGIYHPQQIEFDRLNLTYTLLSKRKLLHAGAGRPRAAAGTIRACRRSPASAAAATRRKPCAISAAPSAFPKPTAPSSWALLEHHVREDLNKRAPRVMAVLRPLRVVIDNYPEGQVEEMEAVNNPEDAAAGTRKVPFSRVLYIEQDDFREDPPKQYFRLSPGREVRLRYGYFITCTGVVKDEHGEVVEMHCTYDPATRGGNAPDGRKVKSTIHWVSAAHAIDAEVRLYETCSRRRIPNETAEGRGFHGQPESQFARSVARLPSWSLRLAAPPVANRLSVRAPGLFLRGPGLRSRQAGLQPHRGACATPGPRSRKQRKSGEPK